MVEPRHLLYPNLNHRPPKPDWAPTALNLATTRRYEACRAAGGHLASGDIIARDTGSLDAAPFTICARCEVPYAKRHISYNGKAITNPLFGILS